MACLMTMQEFQKVKEGFGDNDYEGLNAIRIPVPGLPRNANCQEAGIEYGRMIFDVYDP